MTQRVERKPRDSLDICLTNPFAWPLVKRGSEALISSLASWLRHQGKSLEILAGGPRATHYELDGVPVRLVRARSLRSIHGDLDEEATIIPAMAIHLRRSHPKVVHSFLYTDAAAARLAGRPYLVSYGGIATRQSASRHPIKRRLLEFASQGARVILCPSEAASRHLRDVYGLQARVLPNGFAVDAFPLATTEPPRTILCTATPDDERKRVAVLVEAFGHVHRSSPDTRLVLAGRSSAERRAALLDRVPDSARASIDFPGEVDRQALGELYRGAAVTCLPSLNEAFGLVLLESLATGRPVVAAASGAIPEIIDDQVGELFPPDDVRACADSLLRVLERSTDPDVRLACRQRAEQYDWSVIGPRLLEIYAEVAA